MRVHTVQGPVLSDVQLTSERRLRLVRPADPSNHHLVFDDAAGIEVVSPVAHAVGRLPIGIWVPAGVPYTATSQGEVWVARFEASTCPTGWARLRRVRLDPEVPAILRRLHRSPTGPWLAERASIVVDHLTEAMVAIGDVVPLPEDPRGLAVARALIRDPGDDRSLAGWAAEIGASESSLRQIFRSETGMGFARWRFQIRMSLAARLLRAPGTSVATVARRCGYGTTEAFSRAFKSEVGLAPTQFARATSTSEVGLAPMQFARAISTSEVGLAPTQFAQSTSTSEVGLAPTQFAQSASTVDHRSDRPKRSTDVSNRSTPSVRRLLDLAADERPLQGDDMAKPPLRSTLLLAAALLVIAACGDSEGADDAGGASDRPGTEPTETTSAPSDPMGGTVLITDGLGNDVEVPARPTRIAALDLFTATHLLELGLNPPITPIPDTEWIGGQENLDAWIALGFDPDLVELETVPFGGEINVEAIAAANPDLIVGQPSFIGDALGPLSELAPVLLWESGRLPVTGQLEQVAKLVGEGERAAELVSSFDDRLAAIADDIAIESIAIIDNNNYDGQFYVYGEGGGLTTDWAERLGLRVVAPVVDLDETGGAYVSTEVVPSLDDADAVVVFSEPLYGDPMLEDSLFLALDAVGDGRLCDAGDYNRAIGVFSLAAYADQLEGVAGCLGELAAS
ncbi:MAG: helix-turn-helix domain-containing protein [Actinomycetota bacterium]